MTYNIELNDSNLNLVNLTLQDIVNYTDEQLNKLKRKIYKKQWAENNKTKLVLYKNQWYKQNKERIGKIRKQYHQDNKQRINQYSKKYRKENVDYFQKYKKKYNQDNKLFINRRKKELLKNNIQFKLACSLRSRLNQAIKSNAKSGSAVSDLGCTIAELIAHIESKWLPGMSWDNWGIKGWHIDHIIPLNSVDISDRQQLLKVCHYTNLQPLWAIDNLRKGDRIV